MGATQTEAAATRKRLLTVATRMIRTRSAANLTLDLVAKEAGVSKGGLLHHFPSKSVLLEEVLRHLIDDFAARVQAHYDLQPQRAGRWLRSYILATFDEDMDHGPLPLEIAALLFSAINEQSSLLAIIHQDSQRWHECLMNDGIAPARALLVRHAADAYWMDRVLEPSPIDPILRQAFIDELLHLTEVPAS